MRPKQPDCGQRATLKGRCLQLRSQARGCLQAKHTRQIWQSQGAEAHAVDLAAATVLAGSW